MLKLTELKEFWREVNIEMGFPARIHDRELTNRIMLWRDTASMHVVSVIKKALVNLNMIAVSSQPSLWDIPGNINKAPEVDAITDELVQA